MVFPLASVNMYAALQVFLLRTFLLCSNKVAVCMDTLQLVTKGFTSLRSTPSMFQMPATSSNNHVICSVITDDCVFAAPRDSPTKVVIFAKFGSH